MNVSIEGRVNHKGTWWDVCIDFPLPPGKSRAERAVIIHGTIDALSEIGVISRVGETNPCTPTPHHRKPQLTDTQPMPQSAAIDGVPFCPVHREEMRESSVQKSGVHVHYFCTRKGDNGYCRHRGKIDRKTGKVGFWEVKE